MGRSLDDLGTRRLSWADLSAIVQHAPPGNALDVAMRGEVALYGLAEILAMQILNTLQDANWQRSGDESAPKPRHLTLPGSMERDSGEHSAYGSNAIPVDQFDDWWNTDDE